MRSLSSACYISVLPKDIALFRFLLEAYDNTAYFTVLERARAVLKIVYAPSMERSVQRALSEIGASLPVTLLTPRYEHPRFEETRER